MGFDVNRKNKINPRNFSYVLVEDSLKKEFVEVDCKFIYKNKPLTVYYFYPSKFLKSKAEYIAKAKSFINAVIKNKEIYTYIQHCLEGKAYRFVTSFGYGYASTGQLIETKQEKVVVKTSKKVSNNKSSNPKKHRIALAVVSAVAATGVALSVYFYLTRVRGGGGNNEVTLTFDLQGGNVIGDKQTSSISKTYKTGIKWSEITDSPKQGTDFEYDAGHHLKTWNIENEAITADYVFNKSTTLKASYNVDQILVTIDPAGGTWKTAQTGKSVSDPKTCTVDYGSKWSEVTGKIEGGLEIATTPSGLSYKNRFKINNKEVSEDTKIVSTDSVIAVYESPDPYKICVTFSSGKGSFDGGSTSFVEQFNKPAQSVVTWLDVKSKLKPASGEGLVYKGYTLDTTKSPIEPIADSYEFNDVNTVVTAYYDVQQLNVTINSGDNGKFTDSSTTHNVTVDYGKKWGDIKNNHTIDPTSLQNHKVNSGFAIGSGSTLISDDYLIKTDNLVINAQYVDQEKITIKVDLNGGKVNGQYAIEKDIWAKEQTWAAFKSSYLSGLTAPDGYDVTSVEWYSGSTKILDDTRLDTSIEIKATWKSKNKFFVVVDPNGCYFEDGSTYKKSKEIEYGTKWTDVKSEFEMDVTRGSSSGNIFDYIGTSDESKAKIEDYYVFTERTELKAYTKDRDQVSITLNAGEGVFTAEQSHVITIKTDYGTTWSTLKSTIETSYKFTRTGYTFDKWTTDGTEEPESEFEFTTATTLYATYKVNTYTITLDPAGGTWKTAQTGKQATDPKTCTVDYGTKWSEVATKVEGGIEIETPPALKTFKYFVIGDSTSNTPAIDSYVLTSDTTITAAYDTDGSQYVTLVIDPNGGKFNDGTSAVKIVEDVAITTKWSELKSSYLIGTVPTGYTHDGSFVNGKVTVEDTTTFPVSSIIKANYTATKVNVTLNAGNGGYYETAGTTTTTKSVDYNSTYLDSYKPTLNEGYTFAYYTDGNGVIVDKTYKFTTAVTLTAHYNVTLTFNPGDYGTVTHETASVVTGITKWSEIKAQYLPTITDTDSYKFANSNVYKLENGSGEYVTDDSTFDSPDTLVAQYSINLPGDTKKGMSLDSWTVLCNAADQGFAFLSTTSRAGGGYKEDYDAETYLDPVTKEEKTKTAGTFVGIERVVNGIKVRIIDQNKDETSEGKSTALTFEFESCVGSSGFNTTSNIYSGSSLETYLKNDIYNTLPTDLKSNIKEIKKNSYNQSTGEISSITGKLFALSASEMGISKYPDFDDDVKGEGSAYAYYASSTATSRKKDKAYWLRSADINTSMFTWMIDADGYVGNLYEGSYQPIEVTQSLGVAPCFAI